MGNAIPLRNGTTAGNGAAGHTAGSEPTLFHAVLHPHRSLSATGFWILRSHGKSLAIGSFLTPDARIELARALEDQLHRLRA